MSLVFPYKASLGGLELSSDTVGSACLMVLNTQQGYLEAMPSFGVPVKPFSTLAALPSHLREIEAALSPYSPVRPLVSGSLGDDGALQVQVDIVDTRLEVLYE